MQERQAYWRPMAAYLYVLHLDESALAWEYLRRNADYQLAWRRSQAARKPRADATRFGLRHLEDPSLDGRDAGPDWIVDLQQILFLQPAVLDSALPFCLWDFPGLKRLRDEKSHALMTVRHGSTQLRVAISAALGDGMGYVLALHADDDQLRRWRERSSDVEMMQARHLSATHAGGRPSRTTALHARALQVFDAVHSGATHRDIADALFGAETVTAQWEPDSSLRAHVRHVIWRGTMLVNGGYRSLLGGESRIDAMP